MNEKRNVPAKPEDAPQYLPPEELPVPRLRISQKESDEHVAGVFVNTLTEEEFTEVECVFVDVKLSRILWSKDLSQEDPLCKSRDSKTGEGEPGGDCAACALAVWVDNEKPECSIVYDMMGADNQANPFVFSVSRSGIKPAKGFIAAAQYRGKPIYWTAVRLSLRKVTKPSDYYVPVFTVLDPTPEEGYEELQKLGDYIVKRFTGVTEESDEF